MILGVLEKCPITELRLGAILNFNPAHHKKPGFITVLSYVVFELKLILGLYCKCN